MGLDDRDYARRTTPSAGSLPRPRAWSVNTWLIVICVLVFLVDGLLPIQYVPMADPELVPGVTRLPETAVTAGMIVENPPGRFIQPIFERPNSRNVVGWQVVAPMHPLTALLHFSTKRLFPRFE